MQQHFYSEMGIYPLLQHLFTFRFGRIMMTVFHFTNIVFFSSESPPVFIHHPQSAVVKSYDPITLRCAVSSSTPQISWIHNGMPITVSYGASRGITTMDGTLTIESFKQRPRDHASVGVYNCVATNSVGTVVSKDAILSKAGKNGILPIDLVLKKFHEVI